MPEPALEPAHEGDAAAAARAAREAVEALLDRRAHAGALLQVELRPAAPRRHPLSGERIRPATIAVLWQNEIPLAVLVHDVVAVSRTARRTVRELLVAAARARGCAVERVRERQLWQLLAADARGA